MNKEYKQVLNKVKKLEIQEAEAHKKYTISERGSVEYEIWKSKWEEIKSELETARNELSKKN